MLKLKRVSKYYFSGNHIVQALRRINLEMKIGEFVAITGESGSGKSTLLNVLSGLDTYEEGQLLFNGEDISHYTIEELEHYRKDYIGYVFQEFNILNSYTVYENIELALTLQGYNQEEKHNRVLELIEKVGLSHVIHQKASNLSGGEKQRTVIARTLAKDYQVLVCDEPTGNLNEEASSEIFKLLREISKDKLVIVVSHDSNLLAEYATRKIRLYDGEITEDSILVKQDLQEVDKITPNFTKTNLGGALNIAIKNIISVPKKSLFLFMTIIFILAAVFFVYSASILEKNKSYIAVNEYFDNADASRIVLIKDDKTQFTETEKLSLSTLDYVRGVFNNDVVFDSVFISKNYDSTLGENIFYNFKVLPSLSLNDYQLLDGRLPENELEVVVGSSTPYTINDEVYVANSHLLIGSRNLDTGQFKFKVVGIIEEPEVLINDLHYFYLNNDGLSRLAYTSIFENSEISLMISGTEKFDMIEDEWVTVEDDPSVDVGTRIYELGYPTWVVVDNTLLDDTILTFDLMYFEICRNFGYKKEVRDDMEAGLCNASDFIDSHDFSYRAITGFRNFDPFESINLISFRSDVYDKSNKIYMNEKTYVKFFGEEDYQITVIVRDSFDGNKVIKELDELGYNAYYPAQDLTSAQVSEIVVHNLLITLISYVIIFVVFFGGYFILRNLVFSKLNDYLIIRSIGSSKKTVKEILRFEVFSITAVVFVLLSIFVVICELFITSIPEVLRFFKWNDYLFLILIVALVMEFMVNRFTRLIFKASVVSALKGVER